MQQLAPMPIHPGHATPSSQAIPMPYIQTIRPLTSLPQHWQQTTPPLGNMSGFPASGAPFSSYTFPPSSYGQPQDNANAPSQFQLVSQMHAPVAPATGQPWLSSVSQSAALAALLQ
ncbi:Pre-mRNA-processing protein 40A [Quillaja saponaria]|uniref:Pre-mRNA-processing protein 40A n=1 Tax=Quillaja saponaria TaxID=32244 RepID=A0AAD7PST0_QUISA|nr:Pre-mRNA-processing protein 40A [Quillaja saponaria]